MSRLLPLLISKFVAGTLGRYAPRFSLVFKSGARASDEFFLKLPFRRSFPVIIVVACMLAVFTVPLFSMAGLLAGESDDSLASLVGFLFVAFWMIGWSSAIGLLLFMLLSLSIGRETLHVAGNELTITIGIPGIALGVSYSAELIRNFRYEGDNKDPGKKWRGQHIVFDYGGRDIALGSVLSESTAREIIGHLQRLFPLHDAEPVDIDTARPVAEYAFEELIATRAPEQAPSPQQAKPVRWYSVSGIALILANMVPLFGVLFGDWTIGEIMLLFWAESAIIGFYNLCKMWKVGGFWLLLFGPFFVAHYGAFMVVHLLFIYALFGGEMIGGTDVSSLQVLDDLLLLWPALLGLLISHGISFYFNFIRTEAFRGRNIQKQMREPYKRIIIMHLTILIGGMLSLRIGSEVAALMLLLAMKIAADMHGHLSEHSK